MWSRWTTQAVTTYNDLTTDTENPWANAPGVESYGADAGVYHAFCRVLHGMTPVMNDFNRVQLQIYMTMLENQPKYTAMYRAQLSAANLTPTTEFDYTDTSVHSGGYSDTKTGTETNTRTGNVADSGNDTTVDTTSVTDSANTYDNATMRDIAKSQRGGGVTLTHGKTTTYNSVADAKSFSGRTDTREYSDDTITRTVQGHKTSPAQMLNQYTNFVKNNLVFMEIINDVISAISCIVYIPVEPEEMEE